MERKREWRGRGRGEKGWGGGTGLKKNRIIISLSPSFYFSRWVRRDLIALINVIENRRSGSGENKRREREREKENKELNKERE